MSGLALLQRDVSRYLLREADGGGLLPVVKVPHGIAARDRLEVYGNAYRERLREVLGKDYPCLRRLLGEARFAALAYDYIAEHRSHSPTIRWFGAKLATFMAEAAQWLDEGAARDMAVFEWSLGLAFDAADAAALGVAEIAAVAAQDWAGLRFALHPSLHVVALDHAVADWWLAAQDKRDPALPPPDPLPAQARHWAVWRAADGVRFRRLDSDEAEAIAAVRDGADFATLCGTLVASAGEDQAALRMAGLLRLWVEAGWIADRI